MHTYNGNYEAFPPPFRFTFFPRLTLRPPKKISGSSPDFNGLHPLQREPSRSDSHRVVGRKNLSVFSQFRQKEPGRSTAASSNVNPIPSRFHRPVERGNHVVFLVFDGKGITGRSVLIIRYTCARFLLCLIEYSLLYFYDAKMSKT